MSDLRTAAQQALEACEQRLPLVGQAAIIDELNNLRAALAQQAKPDHETRAELAEQQVVQLAEERDHYRNLWQKAQQDEPLNLADPAVRKRLATQWGYVPAAQAEPVEPVATLTAQRDALLEALKAMLHRDERNTCRHEETHRGGALWEICDSCGAMWADDEGGKPEWEDPKEWAQARAAIKAAEETK